MTASSQKTSCFLYWPEIAQLATKYWLRTLLQFESDEHFPANQIVSEYSFDSTLGSLRSTFYITRSARQWNHVRLAQIGQDTECYDMLIVTGTQNEKSLLNQLDDLKQFAISTQREINMFADQRGIKHFVSKTPALSSFVHFLERVRTQKIVYSEHFISELMRCTLQTVSECHQHNIFNFNLNIDSLGFDNNLRPIWLDFSRCIVLGEEDKISRFYSVMSSTPPELALLMGTKNPLMNIDVNGALLRKADCWRCGVLLYVLTTGKLPYHATSLGTFITQVLTSPPAIPIENIGWVSEPLKDLLDKLLETTYFNRIDVKNALKHQWFTTKLSKASLPTHVTDDALQTYTLQQARSSLAAMTDHAHTAVYTDCEYFALLDPTRNGKALRTNQLVTFMIDRRGYCPYRAKQFVAEFFGDSTDGIEWEQFDGNSKIEEKDADTTLTESEKFANAIFCGLDAEGTGRVNCKSLRILFEHIGIASQEIDVKLGGDTITFQETVSLLSTLASSEHFENVRSLHIDRLVPCD